MKFVLVLAVALFGFASALEFDRECRTLAVVSDFDIRSYAGNWYELKRYETTVQQNGDCSTFDYSYDFAEETVTELAVENRWSYFDDDNSERYQYGVAVLADPANPTNGQLVLTFDDAPDSPVNYNILATDYENYSIVWSCENLGDGRSNEDAWVLSKTQELNADVADDVAAVIAQYLDESELRDTYQGPQCLGIVDPFRV